MVYGLARALVMVLMARTWDEGWTVEVMRVECGRARLALRVGARMSYRPVSVLPLSRPGPGPGQPGPALRTVQAQGRH